MVEEKKYNKLSIIGFILVFIPFILHILLIYFEQSFLGNSYDLHTGIKYFSYFTGIIIFNCTAGIIICIASLKQIKKYNQKGKGLSIASITINTLEILFYSLLFLFGIIALPQ